METEKSLILEKTEIPKHKNALSEKYEKENKVKEKKEVKEKEEKISHAI